MRASGRLHITLEVIRYGETVVSTSRPQRILFQSPDISRTVGRIKSGTATKEGVGPRCPVRAMLLALMLMYLLQMPTVTMMAMAGLALGVT